MESGGAVQFDGGSLENVTFKGALNVSNSVNILGSLTATGQTGTGYGLINISNFNSFVGFNGTQLFDNATINLGSVAGYNPDGIYLADPNGLGNQILTLGPNIVVNAIAGGTFISTKQAVAGDGVINEGAINATSGQSFEDTALNFTNKGVINISNGETFYSYYNFRNAGGASLNVTGTGTKATLDYAGAGYSWSNAGTISVGAGALLSLEGPIANTGIITVANGGDLAIYDNLGMPSTIIFAAGGGVELHGSETTAQLEQFFGGLNVKVRIWGALDNTGANLAIGPGAALPTFTLQPGGVVTGGVVTNSGSGMAFAGGSLDDVSWHGLMSLSGTHSFLNVINSLTVMGAGGAGPGTINLTGAASYIWFQGAQSFDNTTVNMGSATGGVGQTLLESDPNALGGQILTLGAHVTVNVLGAQEVIGSSTTTGDGVVNDGVINASNLGGVLTEQALNFTNNGSINISNGEQVTAFYSFTNTGAVSVGGGGTALTLLGAFANIGTISVASGGILSIYGDLGTTGTLSLASGSTLNLHGAATTAELNTATTAGGGTVNLFGSLNNTGATLRVGPGGGPLKLNLENGGSILGGVIKDAGSGIVFSGLSLNGVTYDGVLNLKPQSSSVTILNGLTATGLNGTGPGTLSLTGVGDDISFQGTQTFDNATINLGSSAGGQGDYIFESDPSQLGSQVLTLGPNIVINALGFYESIGVQDATGTDGVINQGVINAAYSGGYLYDTAFTFTNAGLIDVGNGAHFYDYYSFANTGVLTVSGIGSTANLNWIGGSAYTVSNTGLIIAEDGASITITGNVGGAGKELISGASTLEIGQSTGAGAAQTVQFAKSGAGVSTGTFRIDNAQSFTGAVAGLGTGDTLDLANIAFATATLSYSGSTSGGVLTVGDGTTTAHITLVGNYSQANFHLAADAGGHTNVTYSGAPLAPIVVDTAANLSGAVLDSLQANPAITSIVVSDDGFSGGGDVQLTTAELANDASTIAKLTYANATPYALRVADTALNLSGAELDTLQADTHVKSILVTDNGTSNGGRVQLTVAQLTADAQALGELVFASGHNGGILRINDTAAHVSANLDTISADIQIGRIWITDNQALTVSVAQLTSDAAAIAYASEINNTPAPAKLDVVDTSANLNGAAIHSLTYVGDAIDATNINFATLTATFTENGAGTAGTLNLTDGTHTAAVTLFGQYAAAGFSGTAAAAGFSSAIDAGTGSKLTLLATVPG